MNRKPMEFFESGSNMVVAPNRRIDDAGQGILHLLKPIKRYGRKAIE